jgi:DNA mismatch endonuclease (patch repair protein)
MDSLTTDERSERMGRIKGKGTKPEMLVRRMTHGMGFRYLLHDKRLPGHPDLVFPSRRKVIFVHGCFWHRHENCHLARLPKTRLDFWVHKLQGNKIRDEVVIRQLVDSGWGVLVVWECELHNLDQVACRIREYLEESEKQE